MHSPCPTVDYTPMLNDILKGVNSIPKNSTISYDIVRNHALISGAFTVLAAGFTALLYMLPNMPMPIKFTICY